MPGVQDTVCWSLALRASTSAVSRVTALGTIITCRSRLPRPTILNGALFPGFYCAKHQWASAGSNGTSSSVRRRCTCRTLDIRARCIGRGRTSSVWRWRERQRPLVTCRRRTDVTKCHSCTQRHAPGFSHDLDEREEKARSPCTWTGTAEGQFVGALLVRDSRRQRRRRDPAGVPDTSWASGSSRAGVGIQQSWCTDRCGCLVAVNKCNGRLRRMRLAS